MNYQRKCRKCDKILTYSKWGNYVRASKNNTICKSCCQTGKHFSDEHKKNMSNQKIGTKQSMTARLRNSITQKQRYLNPDVRKKTSESTKLALHRPDVRMRHIEALSKTRWIGTSLDKGQVELLEKWNRLGFKFETNYQIHTKNFLGYIDGYDQINNVVIEYDSKYHSKPSQKIKDDMRQQKIIDILRPKKFWRYDVTNKQWINVVEDN